MAALLEKLHAKHNASRPWQETCKVVRQAMVRWRNLSLRENNQFDCINQGTCFNIEDKGFSPPGCALTNQTDWNDAMVRPELTRQNLTNGRQGRKKQVCKNKLLKLACFLHSSIILMNKVYCYTFSFKH